jgi:hypothetical protein
MSWVEDLKPDDDATVEIIFPKFYVDYNLSTMKKYSQAAAYYCRAAATLGEDETEFLMFDMTVIQVYTLETAMKKFGVEMTHDHGYAKNGHSWTYFYADVRGLKKILEEFGSE